MPGDSSPNRNCKPTHSHAARRPAAARRRKMFLEQLEDRALLAVLTWDGSASNLWSNPANWSSDVAPQPGDDLVFPAGALNPTNFNDLPAGARYNTILIQGAGYNITGGAIELSGGLTANNAAGANTVALDLTLINAQSIISANPAATLNLSGSINTANLIGTTTIFGTSALTFDGAGSIVASGVISGGGSISKLGNGTVTLSGPNTYQGLTDVRQGVLRAQNNTALGSATTGDTQIQQGASLHIAGGVTIAENIALREGGVGFGNGVDDSTLGGLRGVGGTSTITGNIDLVPTNATTAGNTLIGVDAGSTLIVSGVIASPIGLTTRLIKTGAGTLQLAGTQSNIIRGEVRVLKGTLDLNKTPGQNAFSGSLIVGDAIGGNDAATVRLLAANQIPNLDFFDVATNTITINPSGVLNLNGFSDVIGALTLFTGPSYSADVSTGAGTLTLDGNLTLSAVATGGTSGASPAATISGNLNLGTFFSGGAAATGFGGTRTINIADTQLPDVAADLIISANISGAADVSITRTGAGTLRLSGNNTFAGPFLWNGGIIEAESNTAFGTGLLSAQNNGNVLVGIGGPRTLANAVSLDGNLTYLGTDITHTGGVTLTGDRTILTMNPAQTVTFAGAIDEGIFGNRPFAKSGRGTLALTAANTYSGATTINSDGGTLALRGGGSLLNTQTITVNQGGTLLIDNNAGGNLADRINDAGTINLGADNTNGGRLMFRSAAGSDSSETVGTVNVPQNTQGTIAVDNASLGANRALLTMNAFSVGNANRQTLFVSTGQALSETGNTRISIINNPGGLDDGILPQAVVLGPGGAVDFATYGSSAEGIAIIPLPASAYVTDLSQASATSNVRVTANTALTTSKSINALLVDPGVAVSGVNATVTVNSGAIVLGAGSAISTTNLNTGAGFVTVPGGSATISSSIFSGAVQKGGRGTLVLSGDNQTGSAINVNNGILEVAHDNALGSPSGATTVRQGATLRLTGNRVIGLEPITVNGVGFSPNAPGSGLDAYDGGIGALAATGNSSIAGNVTLGADPANLLGLYGGFPVITNSVPFVNVTAGNTLTLTGDFGGASELGKIGAGTLELAGVISRGTDRNNRIFEGTLLLNNEPGIQASRGRYFIGSNVAGAPAATLRLGGSDQIIDDRRVEVFASGLFDLNGNSDVISGEGNFILHVAPSGAGQVNIGMGGVLTINNGIQVHTVGSGNPTGATITGGTLALQLPGVIAGAGTRTFEVNNGAIGSDLTITSGVVDGTGLQSVGIIKNGFGELELAGSTPNSYTGTTTVNNGVLLLNKTAGVNALSGPLTIGNNAVDSGFASSDVVRLLQANQLPDFAAQVIVNTTGLFDLNGFNETIGLADGQSALVMQAGSTVDMNGGVLTVNGNISTNSANGAGLWSPVTAPRITDGTLNLGNVTRVIDIGGDRSELPYELELSANLVGSGGILLNVAANNTGTLLLSGDNSGLTGDVVRTNGNFAVGSDTAFGSGRALLNGNITSFGGKRTISTPILFGANTIGLISGNGTAGIGAIGGGGNDLEFAGRVDITAGTWIPVVANAAQLTFSGGLGETFGAVFARKHGFGTMIVSSEATLSGNLEVGEAADAAGGGFVRVNGGAVVLRDGGTLLNSSVLVGYGGTFQIDNSGLVLANRIGDTAVMDLAGGTLALVGKSGQTVGEAMGQLRLRNNTSSSLVQAILPAGGIANWRFSNYGVEAIASGSNFQFVGRGADISATSQNRIAFTTRPVAPLLVDEIIPQAVLSGPAGFDFVTVTNATVATPLTPFDNFVTALTSGPNFATTLAGATGTVNVKLAASEVVAGAITANALLLPSGAITVSGGGSLTLDSGLLASSGAGNTVSVTNLTIGGANGIVYIDRPGSSLTISSAISATGSTSSLAKGGAGLLNLSGNNLFTGATRVTNGILRASGNNAFGAVAGGVIVQYGGTVELNNVSIPDESIQVAGFGEGNRAAVGFRSIGGASTWAGGVVLNHNRTAIETVPGSTLIIGSAGTAGIVSGAGLNKFGTGALRFEGTANNSFANTSILWQGSLDLAKSAGVNAIPALADDSQFFVGNFYGADNSVVLRSQGNDQIADGPYRLRIMPTGVFNLNGFSETITGRTGGGNNHDVLGLDIGSAGGGDVVLGGGTLRIGNDTAENGRIQVRVFNGGLATGATISGGTLELSGGTAQNRRVLVDDSSALVDLTISATIADGGVAPTNFIKNNSGRLVLSGGNTYTSPTILEGGEVVVSHANALGAGGSSFTQVNAGVSLLVSGVSLPESLSINGAGFGGQGALRNVAGNNTLTGPVTLLATSTIGVNAGQTLDIDAVISGATFGVTKLLPGTLRYSGGGANTYTGATTVSEGTLELNKTAGVNALAGVLTVGNDAGSQNADVVRLLQANQIPDTVQVQVTPSGLLDLNGNNEAIGQAAATGLNLFLGPTTFPRITTGAGVLTLLNGLGVTVGAATALGTQAITSPGAAISGNLTLGGSTNFTVNDAGLNIRELIIDAAITGTAGFARSGTGIMVLSGNNAGLSGVVTLNAGGGIVAGSANALGTGSVTVAGDTPIFATNYLGGALVTQTIPNDFTLSANLTLRGDDNLTLSGALTNSVVNRTITATLQPSAVATLSGTINLSESATSRTLTLTNSTFGGGVNNTVVGGTLNVTGQVVNGGGSTASALTKGGVGLVVLTNNTNSYAGLTTVAGGNLRITSDGALGGRIAEQQTFGVTSTGGGSFTITYNGQTTTALNYAATTPPTALDVQNALNALPSIARTGGVVSVSSSNPAGPATVYTVTFGGNLAGIDVTQIASINFTAPAAASGAITTTVVGGGGTVVNNGATLQVVPGLNVTEPLTLNNNGLGNFGALRFIDQTPGTTETTTWAGSINFNANPTWTGVDGGGINPDRLILAGASGSGANAIVVKTGLGELEFGGNTDNSQVVFNAVTPLDDGLEIRQGAVFFNKPDVAGVNYSAFVGAGRVTVGDGGGGANADRLVLIGTSLNQIGGAVPMTIAGSGQLSLAGALTEQIPGTITLQRLMSVAGSIDSSPTRTLILGGNVDVVNAGITTGATPAATISGQLDAGGARTFTTNDSYVLSPAEDLVISAVVSNATPTFGGAGTAALTGANAYAGLTTINSATLDFNAVHTNGLNFVVNGVLNVRGAGTLGTGGVTVNSGASLVLDNTAATANRIADGATVTVAGGHLRLVGNAGGSLEQIATLALNAPSGQVGQDNRVTIDSSAGGIAELRVTTALTRGASGTTHFVGVGADLGNATNSRIQVTAGASPFVNGVLPWATMSGPAGFDLVTDADGAPAAAPYFLSRVTTYNVDANAGGIVRLNGGTNTLTADRTIDALLLENGAAVNGPFTLTVGTATAGLVVSRTGNNSLATTGSVGNPGLQFAGREPIFLVESGSSIAVSSTTNSTATLWKDRGGSLLLSGDNDVAVGRQLSGAITINAGTLTVSHANGLGSEVTGAVTVNRRSALVFDSTGGNLAINNKPITVNGLGLNDDGSGALRTIGGANTTAIGTGTTAVNFSTNPTVVSVGAGTILDLNATVGAANQPWIKRGVGELILSGSANNGTGAVSMNEGTISLNKSGTAIALNGAVTVDDLGNYDPVGAGTLRYATAGVSTNMIGDVTITVNGSGVFDVNGKTDTIANTLTVNGGSVQNTAGGGVVQVNGLTLSGGVVNTGTGTLNLNGNITYSTGLATGGSATINGNLNLVGGTRTFTVNDGHFVNNDLTINALISNGRLVKAGAGALLLSNAGNTFLAGINEVQRIVVAGATAGTSQFNINFNGNVTATITVDAVDATTAAAIDAALEALPNVGAGGVSVTATGVGQFDITFTGHLAEQDIPNQITVNVVTAPGTYTPSTPSGGVAGINHTAGILSFSSDTAFGTARIQMGSAQLLPVGGDKTLANSLTLNNNVTTVFGGRRDFGGTDDLLINGGVTLHSTVGTGQNLNMDVNDPLTNVTFAGVVSGGGNFIVPTKRGPGRLTLSGNNTFDVRDTITGANGGTGLTDGILILNGALRVAHSNALGGGGTANVHVRNDYLSAAGTGFATAALEIDGSLASVNLPANRNIVAVIPDNQLGAFGLFARSSQLGTATGVVRSLAGSNSIAGIFDVRNIGDNDNFGRVFVGVDAGRFTLSGEIFGTRSNAVSDIRNNREFLKVGAGELALTGLAPNRITGNTAVLNGTLILNKAPGVPAVSGTLTAGDNLGAANSDLVILAAAEQIPDGVAVVVAGSGQLLTNAAQAASLTNEVQQIQVGNAAPTGQFRLQFNGATTGDLAFGSTFAQIQAALNGLSTIGGVGGNVFVTGSGSGQNQFFTVTFLGALAGANQPQIKIVAGTTPFAGATLAVTTLTQGGLAGRETIGAPTLRMAPQATGNISLSVGSTLSLNGDVTVDNYGGLPAAAPTTATISGGALELQRQSAAGGPANRNFNVTSDGPGADDLIVTSVVSDGALGSMSNLVKSTGAASRLVLSGANQHTGATVATTGVLQIENAGALGATLPNEIQNYVVNNALGAATGQYSLTFNAATTANLDFNASADEVAAALNALSTIGGAGGSVSVVSIINGNTNLQYFIRFGGSLAATDVAQITTNAGTLAGGATIGAGATSQGGGLANIAAAQTTVSGSGSLELDNVGTIVNEQLVLNNTGVLNGNVNPVWNNGAQAATGTGALRNVTGNNTWNGTAAGQGNVSIANNPTTIRVEMGTTLTLGATTGVNMLAGAGSLLKTGAGVLELGGTTNNTFAGNTYVNEGTLRLNKQGAAIAIPGGTLLIGDHLGGDNADVVLYASTAGTDQIGNISVRIASTGLLDLNGVSDSITPPDNNQFVMDVGPVLSANVNTGTGTLTLPNGTNKNLTVVANAGTSGASVPAEVAGILSFSATTRQIDVRESSAPVELNISAVLANGAGGFNKAGRGAMAISGNNTYTGPTAVNADSGTLLANTPATVAASAFTVGAGSVLGGTGFITGSVTAANQGSNLTTGGTINPGPATAFPNNTGILTVNNNVTFGTRAVLFADINGTTAGSQHDLLRVGGAGTVTINTTAVNGSVVGGRTGLALPEFSGVKLIDKISVGAITGNFINAAPPSPPALVQIGLRNYNFNYADNSGGVLGDGNDFVLVARASTVTWDGRQDGALANTGSNLWTTANNWVGDLAPAAGDSLLFNNLGVNNASVTPANDFTAGTNFQALLLENSSGSYTISGNQVLLSGLGGGITQDNAANMAVTNTVNLPLATATNPQTITVTDGGLLNLGGAITLGANLSLADGAGVGDLNVTGTINGSASLSIDLAGDATFSAALGGTTPLASISVTTVDDLAFNNNIATSGDVIQTAGTGLTTFSGGTIGGLLTATNEAILLAGVTHTVTGTATLTATVSTISDGNGAANNITAPNVALTAVTGVGTAADPIETMLTNFEATSATGGVFLSNAGALNIGNVNGALNGVDVTGASGNISLVATGSINVSTMNEDISGPADITLNAQGAASDLTTSGNHAPSAIRSSGVAAVVSLTAGRDVLLGTVAGSGHVTSAGSSLVNAGRDVVLRQGTMLDVNSAGTNVVNAGRDIVLFNDGLASRITTRGGLINLTANRDVTANTMSGSNSIDSTQAGTTPAGANITITATTGSINLGDGVNAGTAGNVILNALAGSITDTNLNGASRVVGNGLTAAAATGIVLETAVNTVTSATVSGMGLIDLRELDALTLAIVTTANGNASVTAGGALTNAAGANISVAGVGSFGGSTVTLGNQAGDMVNVASLTFNSAGVVNIAEDSGTQLAGTSTAASLVLTTPAGLTNLGGASVAVTGNASLTAASIALGDQAGDTINFGSLTFTATAGVMVEENSALDLLGVSMAPGAIALTSVDQAAAGQNLAVPAGASVTSTGSSVTLTAGDNLTVAVGGAVVAATTVTLNADTLADADGGTGAAVLLAGTVTATAGDLTINTGADNDGVTVSGVLTAGSAGAGNGNIAINLGAGSDMLTADGVTAGTFNAVGDLLLIAGGAGADVFGLGSATNAAVINAATTTVQGFDFGGSEGVGVDGGDTFNVRFSTTTNFVLEGDDPTMAPGDVVNIDFTGVVGIATEMHGDPNTVVSVAGFNPITYREMEGSNSLGGLVNHVFDLDMFVGGTIFDVQLLDANTLQVALDGMVFFSGLDNGVNSLTFAGRAGTDDALRIHGSATGLLLSEAGGLPGMGAMPLVDGVRKSVSASFTAAQRSLPNTTNPPAIYFDGRGGSDAIVLDLTSARDAAFFSDSAFAGAGDLSVQAAGGPLNGLAATFRNLESVHVLNRSGAGGSLLVDATSTPLTASLTVTNIADPVAPLFSAANPVNNTLAQGGMVNLVFAGASQLTSDVGVLPTTFGGFQTVTVRGGNGATGETLTIASADGAASIGGGSLASLILDGGSTRNLADAEVAADLNSETLRVQSLPASVTATLLGRGGNDIYSLFDSGNTVDNILGQVIVDGGPGANDQLLIVDTGDLSGDTVFIDTVGQVAPNYRIEGITGASGAGVNDIIYRNIDTLTLTATAGDDVLDAKFLTQAAYAHDLKALTLNGWTGADRFLLDLPDNAPGSLTSGLTTVNLNGDAPGNPNAGDQADTFGQSAPGIIGTGAGQQGLAAPARPLRPSLNTAIVINGGRPSAMGPIAGDVAGDVLNLDLSLIPTAATRDGQGLIVSTNPGQVLAFDNSGTPQPYGAFNFTEIEDLNLYENNVLTNLQIGDLLVRATDGDDSIQFSKAGSSSNPGRTRMRLNNLVVDFTLTGGKVIVFAKGGKDNVSQQNVEGPAEFFGEDGNDYLAGGIGNDLLVGGLGNDRADGSNGDNVVWGDNMPTAADPNPQDSAIGGNDKLGGFTGNDVFYGGGGDDSVSAGPGDDFAYGGPGNDALSGAAGNDRLFGGEGNDTISGDDGDDLISGGAGSDKLIGRTGADVVIGGDGADIVDGGLEVFNDLLVGGIVAGETPNLQGDATDLALLALLVNWATSSSRAGLGVISPDNDVDTLSGGKGSDQFNFEFGLDRALDVNPGEGDVQF